MTTKNPEFQVLFGSRKSWTLPLPKDSILIVPAADGWNDFGHQTRVDIRINLTSVDNEFSTSGFIGFLSLPPKAINGTARLRELTDPLDSITLPASNQHHFFTMLPNMEAYRKIARELTVDRAAAVLHAANDLVALNELDPSVNWINSAVQTDVFSMSFIRDSESFFAYKNAGPLLRGLEMERLDRLSSTFTIDFQLAGFNGPHELRFDFDHDAALPKRIAVLIGKNGVGKSQTLGRIARAALDGDNTLSDGTEGGRPIFSRILAFAPTNEAEAVFPAGRRKRPRVWYQRFSLNRTRKARRNDYLCDLIIQVARSTESIAEKARWKIFLDALEAISASSQLSLPTRDANSPYVNLVTLTRTNEQSRLERFASIDFQREPVRVVDGVAYPLSSGEISFLKFSAQVSLYIENGSLLLLDEPETHLHPNFISKFVSLLDHLLAQTGSAAILSTHSVYFVREVFKEQVTVLRKDDEGQPRAEHPRLRTFGADVGAISYFVFGEDEPSKLGLEIESRLKSTKLPWDVLYSKYKDEFSLEFLNSLRASVEN